MFYLLLILIVVCTILYFLSKTEPTELPPLPPQTFRQKYIGTKSLSPENESKPLHINQSEVRKVAYALWEEEGRPEGRDLEFWTEAEYLVKVSTYGAYHTYGNVYDD